jgi:hypothetical protein
VEVDFILHGPLGFYAFEIKYSQAVSQRDAKGLRAFKQDFPEVTLYLIYGGSRQYNFSDVTVLPMGDALKGLLEILQSQTKAGE